MDWNKLLEDFNYYLAIERSLSQNTTFAYMTDCRRFGEFMTAKYPDLDAKDIETKQLNEFLDTIIVFKDSNEEEKILKATSLSRIIQSLRALFRYMIFTDIIDKDVSKLLITPKLEQKLPDFLSKEEIKKMLTAIDTNTPHGYRNYISIELLFATGLRVSEFINLKLENINFKDEYLDIIGKGDKERYVPIATKVLEDLKFYIEQYRPKMKIAPKYSDYVFLSATRGTKLTRQFLNKLLNETAASAGITKNIHPHILRHSFATELIRAGASLIAIKEMMGHASVRSTEIYINLNTEDLKQTLIKYHPFYQ